MKGGNEMMIFDVFQRVLTTAEFIMFITGIAVGIIMTVTILIASDKTWNYFNKKWKP